MQIGSDYALPDNYVTVSTLSRPLNGLTEAMIMEEELFKRSIRIIEELKNAQSFGVSGLTIAELQAKLFGVQNMLQGVRTLLKTPSQESIRNENRSNLNAANAFKIQNR